MGRWAQARKRGRGSDIAAFPMEPPVLETDYQVVAGDDEWRLLTVDPYNSPAVNLEVEQVFNGGAPSSSEYAPGSDVLLHAAVSTDTLDVRARWVDGSSGALSAWNAPAHFVFP